MTIDDHRRLGVSLFNHVWELMQRPERSPEEIDEMIHAAHASRYHWGRFSEGIERARGDWQCSRMYSVLGRGEPALWHARRCRELVEAADDAEDWDLPFAYEALARAHAAAGHAEEAAQYATLAREAGASVADEEDRRLLDEALATLPG